MIEFNRAPAWLEDIEERRFVCWGWRDKDGKRTKPPLKPSGAFASTSNPKTWRTLSGVLKALDRQAVPLDGIGYVMTEDTERIAFDLDKCRNPETGVLAPWARELLARSDTYAELTPSGEGVRAIGLAPAGWRSKVHKPSIPMPDGGSLEIYFHAERYITVTGAMVPGAPEELADISEIADEYLDPETVEHVANGADDAGAPSLNEMVDTVRKISPEVERGDWIKVGHAIKAAGEVWPEEAEKLWLEWCASSEEYGEANADGAAQAAWDGFKPTRAGYGTLVWYSQEFSAVEADVETAEPNAPSAADLPSIADAPASRWDGQEVPEQEFVIDGLAPRGRLANVAGVGGAGKGILMQTAATCIAAGLPFLGKETLQGPVAYYSCEDDDATLQHRQVRINDLLGLSATPEGLFIRSYLGFDLTMFTRGKWTKLFDWLWADIDKLDGAVAAVIDPLSEVYADDYINPVTVKTFCRRFDVEAFKRNMTAFLLMHTAKGGDTQKTPFGSAQWLYAARTTLILEPVAKEFNDSADEAVLRIAKGNLVKPGTEISLIWTEDALLVQADEPDAHDKIQQERALKAKILEMCEVAWETGMPLSDSPQANTRFLPARLRQATDGAFTKAEVVNAMNTLLLGGQLKVSRTHNRYGLKVVSR
jgi:RecA-family ATPase